MIKKSSIDAKELNKFTKTSEEWWDTEGEFKILHKINPLRIDYIVQKILYSTHPDPKPKTGSKMEAAASGARPILSNVSILDVGCGGGLISIPLCKLGAKITALDANNHNIIAASLRAKAQNLTIEFVTATAEEYLATGILHDIVICLEVIEHVSDPQEFMHTLTKLVKPGGMIILSTINRTPKSYAQAIIMAEYVLNWVKAGTHDYHKFIKPSELNKMLQGTKFYIDELKGLKFNPIAKDWYLSENIDVNYFACLKS